MKDFLTPLNWFYTKYQGKDPLRFWSEQVALNLLYQRGGKIIVETGSIREIDDWGAGMSTYIWGDFIQHYGGKVITVDIDPKNIDICKKVTEPFKHNIEYVVSDSVEFLKSYIGNIDLLYLDSMDFPLYPDEESYKNEIVKSQEHNMAEFLAAEDKLTNKSIVLIDDYDFPRGGKAGITNEYLVNRGWECLIASKQILRVKK